MSQGTRQNEIRGWDAPNNLEELFRQRVVAFNNMLDSMIYHILPLDQLGDLTPADLRLLLLLKEKRRLTFAEMRHSLQMSRADALLKVDRLSKRTLLERRADASAGRRVYVRLTHAGHLLLKEMERRCFDLFQDAFCILSEEEKEVVRHGLQILCEATA